MRLTPGVVTSKSPFLVKLAGDSEGQPCDQIGPVDESGRGAVLVGEGRRTWIGPYGGTWASTPPPEPEPVPTWVPIVLKPGFTGDCWLMVWQGWATMTGTATRTAGNFAGYDLVAALPSVAKPSSPPGLAPNRCSIAATPAGFPLGATLNSSGLLSIRSVAGTASNAVDLASIPPWKVA